MGSKVILFLINRPILIDVVEDGFDLWIVNPSLIIVFTNKDKCENVPETSAVFFFFEN